MLVRSSARRLAAGIALLVGVQAYTVCACHDSRRDPNAGETTERVEHQGLQPEEGREAEEEGAQRRHALAALAAYRAPSCAAAIAKIEGLLQRGQGRWAERDETGALPDDLLALLSEAELWRNQSVALCADQPPPQRFSELTLLMDALWRYPSKVSKSELDRRLHVLSRR